MQNKSSYQAMHDQWSQATPPDPKTFINMIWQILTPHQQDLVKALLSNPPGTTAQAPVGAAPAQPAPAANPVVGP